MTLVDILGAEGATADPGHLASVASQFESVARDSDHARHLLSTGSPIQWVGQASDLFEQHLSQLPDQLSKVSLSIGHAAGALWTYSHTLEEILPQARNLSTQLEQIRRELTVNRRLLTTATDPTQVKHLNQRIADLTWDERTTRNKARALRTWLSDAAAVCVDQLRQAGEAGMQNSWTATVAESWHSSVWVAGYVFDHVVKAVEVFGKMIVEPFATLNTAVLKFVEKPSWTTAAPMFRAAAAVTGEVAFIATIVALCLTGVGAPAAGVLISSAGGLAGNVALGAGALAVASDVGIIATGKKVTALELGGDVVGVVAGGLSKVGTHMAQKAVTDAVGKQVITGGAKTTLAQHIQTHFLEKSAELNIQVAELRTLGKLDVALKDPNAALRIRIPLITHVNNYRVLDEVFVNKRFMKLTIANHVLDIAGDAKDVIEKIADFKIGYGQAVTQ